MLVYISKPIFVPLPQILRNWHVCIHIGAEKDLALNGSRPQIWLNIRISFWKGLLVGPRTSQYRYLPSRLWCQDMTHKLNSRDFFWKFFLVRLRNFQHHHIYVQVHWKDSFVQIHITKRGIYTHTSLETFIQTHL